MSVELRWELPADGPRFAHTESVVSTPEVTTTRTATGYEARAGEWGSFLIDQRGEQAVARPSGRCTKQELEDLFAHTIVPRLHQLRGTPCLHASAVAIQGRCCAFLGPSGTGKSTLAASLAHRWPLVADDALLVSVSNGNPTAVPGTPTSRLRDDSANHMQLDSNSRVMYGKRVAEVPTESSPLPLGALYVLDVGDTVFTAPLSLRDALLALAQHLHRLDPFDAELLTKEVSFLESIVRQVPVRRLLYPRRFESIADVADVLLRDFEDDERGRGKASEGGG